MFYYLIENLKVKMDINICVDINIVPEDVENGYSPQKINIMDFLF
jgi:hypothetical protein